MASSNPRAQAFARALEEARRRETGRDGVQGGVVAGEDVMEGVAAEADHEAIQGGPEAVDVPMDRRPQAAYEAVQAGQRRDKGAIDARPVVQETAAGPVVPFSGLHLAQGRQSQPVQVVVHGVPPPVITDMGSEPVVVPPRPPSHFAPQEVRHPLDADELARDAMRDVTRLDRRIFDRRLEHPAWQAIPSVPWGPASPVWSGSTSTGGRTAGDVPGTVAKASARVVLLRKGGGPVTIEEDDPETDVVVREEDKDYEGEEEGEEDSESGSGGDDDYGDDGPPPPPPMRASRHSAAQTSSSAQGRRRSASGTRGGARRRSGKGKKGC
ncbi:hypothetical protein CBR_g37256 [Chara braunii]|uniref:Uncharacterized protein n=1 Tax=Chara braunii TaxID=69332 RepID=A0A388LMH2_CHABU|nr:hypothetical protein CBR_g37256 [Chara braunii]|eukprot:GBG83540.1 hypothetical protein CBR_g37256 [Chara braunii]